MDGLSIGKGQIQGLRDSVGVTKDLRKSEAPGASFADTLETAIGKVNELQKDADKQMQNLATGKTENVADVMMATEKADIALRLMVQVRNKIIDAYQEIMKMQV